MMSNTENKAREIITLIKSGKNVSDVKNKISSTPDEWYRYSSKAYNICLKEAKKERKEIENKKHVSATSNNDIDKIITLNEILLDYSLTLPILTTNGELVIIEKLAENLPNSEPEIIKIIGKATLNPRLRVLQKKGRIEKFEYFKVFSKIIDAATLSYYRTNFISCYLTLIPVIEGIIIRWMGYSVVDEKPDFETIRKFFKNSPLRQPCPSNILFHNVFAKASNEILNHHFYKPTDNGDAYANFNRHVASHLLTDDNFGTKENCIRLFILLDVMTEIFLYETKMNDPRFNLTNQEIEEDIELFSKVIIDNTKKTPENIILNTELNDLII